MAKQYVNRGWQPIPVQHRNKKPIHGNWGATRVTTETCDSYFPQISLNIGVLLGEPSNGLIDIDLDCVAAVELAPRFLVPTATFGRAGKPRSHYLYQFSGAPPTEKFVGENREMLLELRSTGCMTVFPGSVHMTGEPIEWTMGGAHVTEVRDADVKDWFAALNKLAAASLLVTCWKPGTRDDLSTALAGAMLRDGWSVEEIDEMITAIAEIARDSAAADRLKAARLAEQLSREAAVPGWRRVSDLLGATTSAKLRKWLRRQGADSPLSNDEIVDDLNRFHACVVDEGRFAILNEFFDAKSGAKDFRLISVTDLDHRYANKPAMLDGKQTTASKVWFKSPRRRQYGQIVFKPSPPGAEIKVIPGAYNYWYGFAVEPKPGSCERFLAHVKNNICRGDEALFTYVEAWLADAVQNVGGPRPGVALVLRGKEGVGKGVFAKEVGSLFGQHFTQINNPYQLLRNFNAHLKDKVLVFADEAFFAGDKAHEGILKGIITEDTLIIEPKGVDSFTVENHMRFIFASNSDWVVPAGPEARRFCVLDVGDDRMQDAAYFKLIAEEMKGGGREALLDHLLKVDLNQFDLRKLPRTDALLETKRYSLPPIDSWWYECARAGAVDEADDTWPNEPIPIGDLYECFRAYLKRSGPKYIPNLASFTMRLHKLIPGLRQSKITLPSGKRARAYELPILETVRKHWDAMLGGKIDWPEGSAALKSSQSGMTEY